MFPADNTPTKAPRCRFTAEDVFNYSEDLDLAEPIENPAMAQHVRECPKCKAILDDFLQAAGAARKMNSTPAKSIHAASPNVIGEFKILNLIAEGGMGKVFKAYDPSLDRLLALKVMKEELSTNARFCERFMAEAKALAKLNHPNIVFVHTVGRHEGKLFIAMELVEGQSLTEKIINRRPGMDEAVELFCQILEGVNAAHKHNIIHRDIKPANIMVSNSGLAKVLDFGLAKDDRLDTRNTFTAPGAILGTLAYLAPEIVMGEKATVQSDIYALGLVYYQLLTGKLPYSNTSESFKLIERIKTEALPLPSALNPAIPAFIEQLIMKMCAKKPEARHQSIATILHDLKRSPGALSGSRRLNALQILYCGNCGAKTPSAECTRPADEVIYCSKCAPLFEHTTSALMRVSTIQAAIESSPTVEKSPAITKFYFCEKCGKRITDQQILEGQGRDKKLKGFFCNDCAVGVLTMEMDAINIAQLVQARPRTPSPPVSNHDEIGQSPRKGSRVIRPHDAVQKHLSGKPAKADRFPVLLVLWAVVVVGGLAALAIVKNHAAPQDRQNQLARIELAPNSLPPEMPRRAPAVTNPPKQPEANPKLVVPESEKNSDVANETAKRERPDEQTPPAAGISATLPVKDPSLVGYWKFDEGSGAVAGDSSGNGNNGTLVNGPQWTTGKVNGALQFNGNNAYVNVAESASLNADQITVSAWININSAKRAQQFIISKKVETNRAFVLKFMKTRVLQLYVGDNLCAGSTVLSDQKWYYIVGTYDGSSIKIYINGALDASQAAMMASGWNNAQAVVIGGSSDSSAFTGMLDEVRMYNRALSQSEIQGLAGASSTIGGAPPPGGTDGEPGPKRVVPASEKLDAILKELAPILRQNRFSAALELLEARRRDPAYADAVELINSEQSDLADVQALRSRAMEALRAKAGTVLTLKKGTLTGTVMVTPNKDGVELALKDGPELTVVASQLDANDVDILLLPDPGADRAEDLRRRGMLFLTAGELNKAKDYFMKARDAGLASAVTPYLDQIVVLKSEAKEAAALEAWNKAEELFANKNWKAAKQAYEQLQHDYAGSATEVNNAVLLKERLETIVWALGPPRELSLDFGDNVKMELELIVAGEFEMGSNDGDKNEKPVHKVKISQAFYMGKYVVTQAQYKKVMGINPSHFKGENLPVDGVRYFDAIDFCRKASQITGKAFRLPTEAEWEYACRAGTKTRYNTGDSDATLDQAGWCLENSETKMHPVGQKKPNAWGLYDMHGNVYQWCQDWYGEDFYITSETQNPAGPVQGMNRVLRGGSFDRPYKNCRSSCRVCDKPQESYYGLAGFRVAVAPQGAP